MRGAVQVMKHMKEYGDPDAQKKMEGIERDLKEKEEELDNLEELNQMLIVKEQKSNDELQEARKELINVSALLLTFFFLLFFRLCFNNIFFVIRTCLFMKIHIC